MANKRIIELQERTSIDMGDWLIVDSSTSTRKLSLATLFNYMTYSSMIFVTELPTTDISTTTIYLVPHSGSTTDWDEYIYRENEWVLIGTSTIDLSAIYQTNEKAAIQNKNIAWYGTSSTAGATAAKVATTPDENFSLVTGAKVKVKFTNANTATNPTLNVDNTGAKPIMAYGTNPLTYSWAAGSIVEFTYDGTNWIAEYSIEGGYGTVANSETNFTLTNTTHNFAVTETGVHCITFYAGGQTSKHDISVAIGGTQIASGYVSTYERLTCQVPLRKGTLLTFNGLATDGVSVACIKNYV